MHMFCSAQQPLGWHRMAVFIPCLVITVVSSWALSNRICLHMISSHMMTQHTFGSCQQHCPCCTERTVCYLLSTIPYFFFFFFFFSFGKTTKINVNAVIFFIFEDGHPKETQKRQCKVTEAVIQAPNRWILPIILFSFSAGPRSVHFRLSLKQEKGDIAKVLGVATVNWII